MRNYTPEQIAEAIVKRSLAEAGIGRSLPTVDFLPPSDAMPGWMDPPIDNDPRPDAKVIELFPRATCQGCIPWGSCRIHGATK